MLLEIEMEDENGLEFFLFFSPGSDSYLICDIFFKVGQLPFDPTSGFVNANTHVMLKAPQPLPQCYKISSLL